MALSEFTRFQISWRSWRDVLALAAVILSIFIPRSIALDHFVTADEHLWLSRSANFYYALTHADLPSTYQKEHPGVTVMWAGTAAFLLQYPGYRGSGVGQLEPDQFHYYITRVKKLSSLELLAGARLILVIGHTIVLALGYLFARQLIGLGPALMTFMFIAFDPFHLALTRVFHLDGLSSNLVFLALLAFLHYLRRNSLLSLLVSGIAAGLGWLTKSPALLLIPVVGVLALVDFWKRLTFSTTGNLWQLIRRAAWPVMLWAGLGMLVFVAFWPAMWIDPANTLLQVLSRAQRYAEQGHFASMFFKGVVYEQGRIGPQFVEFYPLTFLWRTTPIILLGILLALPGGWLRVGPFREPSTRLTLFGVISLIGIFVMGLTLSEKMADRYLLPAFLPANLIAGLGWAGLFSSKAGARAGRFLLPVGIAAVLAIQAVLSLSSHPYYFTYYNPIMGGSQKAAEVLPVGWGEGIDQAARYLNQKPAAEDLHVISWYPAGSFNFIFKGHTRGFPYTPEMKKREWENFINADYAVIYINQWQRQLPKPVLDYVSERTPEETVVINNLEYVRIYKIR